MSTTTADSNKLVRLDDVLAVIRHHLKYDHARVGDPFWPLLIDDIRAIAPLYCNQLGDHITQIVEDATGIDRRWGYKCRCGVYLPCSFTRLRASKFARRHVALATNVDDGAE